MKTLLTSASSEGSLVIAVICSNTSFPPKISCARLVLKFFIAKESHWKGSWPKILSWICRYSCVSRDQHYPASHQHQFAVDNRSNLWFLRLFATRSGASDVSGDAVWVFNLKQNFCLFCRMQGSQTHVGLAKGKRGKASWSSHLYCVVPACPSHWKVRAPELVIGQQVLFASFVQTALEFFVLKLDVWLI